MEDCLIERPTARVDAHKIGSLYRKFAHKTCRRVRKSDFRTFSALSASLHLCVRLSTEDFRFILVPQVICVCPSDEGFRYEDFRQLALDCSSGEMV